MLLYLNVVFAAGRSWLLVVPNRSSLSYLWQLAMQGMTDADRFSPPVPLTPGLLLLGTAGIGLAALATDALAVRLRSSAVAGLPLLALFIVPTTTPAARGGFGTTLVFCLATAGYLLILNADGRERIRRWGRPVGLWGPGVSSRRGYAGQNAGQYTGRNAGRYTGQNTGGYAGGPRAGLRPCGCPMPARWRRPGAGSGRPRSWSRCACRCSCPVSASTTCSPRTSTSSARPGRRWARVTARRCRTRSRR